MAPKKDVYEMADELGLKKENVDAGMKVNPDRTVETVTKAYEFKQRKGKTK